MKLLQINVTANRGSTGRIAEEIGRVAMAQGWESWIAYGRGKPQSTSRLIRIGNDFDMKLHAVETRLFDNHGLASRRVTRQFIKRIEDIKPDVIHLHNIHGYYINYKLLFDWLKRWGGPVVWTLHDCWSLTGHCSHYDFIGCDRWQTGCHDCPQSNRYPASRLCDRSSRNWLDKREAFTGLKNMTIVPVSDWLKGEVEKSFLNCYPIHCIHNGIDLAAFRPTPRKFEILGVASVWDERKGLADFIKLRSLLPTDAYGITLVGLTDNQIAALPADITGIRRTNSVAELARLYSEADVYVNFSVEETLGLTSLEAQACGTPCIVYRATACPETVCEASGRVVEKGDVDAAAQIIKAMQSNKLRFDPRSITDWVASRFAKEDRYADYISKYAELQRVGKMGGGKQHIIVGVASVWGQRKGLDAFKELRKLLPADEYAITIVGLTAKQIETLPQGITGIRRTNNVTELARLYSESNALVNPTLEDSYPTVNLEAMACGLPVITYRTGGSPESVTPETGLVVPKGDISALADAVRAVCSGSIPISRAACRARAEDIADKAKAYRQYIRLYNSI